MHKFIFIFIMSCNFTAQAVEHEVQGLLDLRYSLTNSISSYLEGGYGKFRYNDGSQVSLAQGTLSYKMDWENTLSLQVIANAYSNEVKGGLGITEAYAQYKSLPFENGYRIKVKAGLMYPQASMTNILTGWSSPYTLSYSTINSWIAEELRHQGIELSLTRLGKFSNSAHDFEVNFSAFQANDPAGAMMAWHGWVMTSRQTLADEKLALPNSHIGFVPDESNVYLELDDRIGYQLNTKWTWREHGKVEVGYYDNNGDPRVVENVQWAWRTKFYHVGIKWQFADNIALISQYLNGDTLMQTSSGNKNLVFNDYESIFVMMSKKLNQHRISARIETFSVTDNDELSFDDNNEDGDAVTLNYNYRVNEHTYVSTEYNWINSSRPSRAVNNEAEKLIERQLQLSLRYYF